MDGEILKAQLKLFRAAGRPRSEKARAFVSRGPAHHSGPRALEITFRFLNVIVAMEVQLKSIVVWHLYQRFFKILRFHSGALWL